LNDIKEIWNWLEKKTANMTVQLKGKSPHATGKDFKYDTMPTDWWTSGFWPGILWIMYDITGEERFRKEAWGWDADIEQWLVRPSEELHHDVGFQFLSTAVIKYTLTGDEDGKRRGLSAANFLAGRFNIIGRFIRAWNWHNGLAIIDSSMNISLLFWASKHSEDPRFKHIAIEHANTLLNQFIRADGSVNHIVRFDPNTGECIESLAGQGCGSNSAWSRGQAWALYGMANTFRNTNDQRFLNAAKRVAHFFVASLPEDSIPYWDFRLENLEGAPKDSSAAAIAASGLIELADLVPAVEARYYKNAALKILDSLFRNYSTKDLSDHDAILLHGTGHKPMNLEVDHSLIYGDYFFVEAVAKLLGWDHRIY
jgi:unsaturated chondroitin disaccharide hydrolase